MTEAWKDVIKVNGVYRVSNLGRLKSYTGRIITPKNNGRGYRYYQFKKPKPHNIYVHKLVLENFICKRPIGYHANHRNGKKSDNRLSNLEWVTPKENARHKDLVLGKQYRGENCTISKLKNSDINEITYICKFGFYQEIVGDAYGISQTQVSRIVRRVNWAHIADS